MGKKDRAPSQEEKRSAAEYYRLNTKAVDDLVTADVTNSPKVSEEELRKYRSGPKIRLKSWLKIFLVKWWFSGAACFFFLWGLGTVVPSVENQMIILGIGMGLITDLLVNNIFRYYEKQPGANERWIMVHRRGAAGLLLNVLYAFVLLGCVVTVYNVINRIWIAASGAPQDQVPVGVEPILFGLLTTGCDLLFLGGRRMFRKILEDAKRRPR